jgi:hypothetical protein
MTSPAENAWRQASKWRKQARDFRKRARKGVNLLKGKDSTLSKKLLGMLAAVDKAIDDPKAPSTLDTIIALFRLEHAEAAKHLLAKIKNKDTNPTDREKLEKRWEQWSLTSNTLFDVRDWLARAPTYEAAAEMQSELGDVLDALE